MSSERLESTARYEKHVVSIFAYQHSYTPEFDERLTFGKQRRKDREGGGTVDPTGDDRGRLCCLRKQDVQTLTKRRMSFIESSRWPDSCSVR